MLAIPEIKDVFVGELAERGEWVVANVHTNGPWPVNAQKVLYRGEVIWILPLTTKHFPAIAVKLTRSREQCELLLMRFLSNVAWVEDQGFLVEGIGGGSIPAPMGRDKEFGFSICEEFDLSYFPEPTDEKALLALALMREGRGLNHPGYAFLSFYRVLEVALPNGRHRKNWVSDKIDLIDDHYAKQALNALRAKGITDIGGHLYESGRCAIAHASQEPIIDPDDPSHTRRLHSELPIVRALAQIAIEEQLGVETSRTVWEKHLYELAGFKKLLGADIVNHLTSGNQITDERTVEIPDINVQIRRRDPYPPLSNLTIKEVAQGGSVLRLRFESNTGRITIWFDLDFAEERLKFDMFRGLVARDTGSADSADDIAEVQRFSAEYFGNGQLQLFNASTGELISRKDAYIPVNMRLDHEAVNADIAHWKSLAEQRRQFDRRYAEEMARFHTSYAIRVGVSCETLPNELGKS
jgi:hypothetical protein